MNTIVPRALRVPEALFFSGLRLPLLQNRRMRRARGTINYSCDLSGVFVTTVRPAPDSDEVELLVSDYWSTRLGGMSSFSSLSKSGFISNGNTVFNGGIAVERLGILKLFF